MRDDGTFEQADAESIFDNALIGNPLGSPGSMQVFKAYNNAIVYFFSFLSLWFVIFGLVAIPVAIYRVKKRRPHALRSLSVAIASCGVGATVLALQLS
jgi:hypothetical protein